MDDKPRAYRPSSHWAPQGRRLDQVGDQGLAPAPGPVGCGDPAWPKLPRSRLKSVTSTRQSPVRSVRPSKPGSPQTLPKLPRSRLKSVTSARLSLLISPARCRPSSTWVTGAPASITGPVVASVVSPLAHQV